MRPYLLRAYFTNGSLIMSMQGETDEREKKKELTHKLRGIYLCERCALKLPLLPGFNSGYERSFSKGLKQSLLTRETWARQLKKIGA